MHGRIFWQFRDYAQTSLGPQSWDTLLKSAGLHDRVYLMQAYPDTEAVALIEAAAKLSGKSISVVLQEFGEFTVPFLLEMYAHVIKPEWRTLDVIEHAEKVAHGRVRQDQPGAAPPYLRARRVNPRCVVLTYNSPRKLCWLAVGVGHGLGKHFQERVAIRHHECMHQGSDHCEIVYEIG